MAVCDSDCDSKLYSKSFLNVDCLTPPKSMVDIETLRRKNAAVGCNGNSFIIRYLIIVLNFKAGVLRRLTQ